MWADFLKNVVLKPTLQRLLPVGATLLVAGGDWLCQNWNACGLVTEQGANMVVGYVLAVALLVADLLIEAVRRVRLREKVEGEMIRRFAAGHGE